MRFQPERYISEEIIVEQTIAFLKNNLPGYLDRVWEAANNVLMELGLSVPVTPPPNVDPVFHRFDLKTKWSDQHNNFLVGAAATIAGGGVSGAEFINAYGLTIAYNQGKVIQEKDMKRDYFAFRVRDALIQTMKCELYRINSKHNYKISLSEITNTNGEGFILQYDLG